MKNLLTIAFFAFLIVACKDSKKPKTVTENTSVSTVYYNGDIITMSGDTAEYVQALVVTDGKISFAGNSDEAMKIAGSGHIMIDLDGKTLLPGFVDPHSHFINALGMSDQANCSPTPVGNGNDVAGIIDALKDIQVKNNIPEGELIRGYGYDDTVMPEGETLNRDNLDEAFPNNPVVVIHVSLHGGVLNSKAMEMFNISAETKTPAGGVIVRKPGTNEPYGLFMESAFFPVFESLIDDFKCLNSNAELVMVSGSSGKIYAQIKHGAPFDIFLSANMEYPEALIANDQAEASSLMPFATGPLLLWTTHDKINFNDHEASLSDTRVHRIALANADTAPYGSAALEVLKKLNLFSRLRAKFVIGENVSQAAQFFASGNAEVGFVALSLVLAPQLKNRGQWIKVPLAWHRPLIQGAVMTKRGTQNPLARDFLSFLQGPVSRNILTRYGYEVPTHP